MKQAPFYLLLILVLVTFSCEKVKEKAKSDFQRSARGEADEMVLVIDTTSWNRELGNELQSVYNSLIKGLPQDESRFNVHVINPRDLNATLRSAVNMVFVMTLDNKSSQSKEIREYFSQSSLKMIQSDSSRFMAVRQDEFAKGQKVLYLFSSTEEQLTQKIRQNKKVLLEVFESAVRKRTRAEVLAKLDKAAMGALKDAHGYSLKVPYGYDIAKNLKDFAWIRKLDGPSEINFFIYESPYKDQNVFNDIGAFRDGITETYLIDSEKPDIFVTRQHQINIVTERVSFNGRFAVKTRGLWKVSDSSGGGPFVSFALVDEENQTLYYIEGYVYSPGTKKKKLVREVEAVLSTFKCPSDLTP